MSQKVSKQEVEKIAKLARIKLTEQETNKFSVQLTDILNYVDQLSKIDTANVKPTAQATELINVMRPDKVESYKDTEKLIKAAPESKNNQVKVKKVL